MTIAQMQVRRGLASEWASANPTLANGEWGLETDTGKMKMGNGGTAWNSLDYFADYAADITAVQAQVDVLGPRQIVKFTSSGSFTKATYPWLKYVRVIVVGSGGGGGGAATTAAAQVSAGSGGGGGGYAESIIPVASLGASETVTIGAVGSGGAAGNNAGTAGGACSFGSLVAADGGSGGSGGAAGTGGHIVNGAAGAGTAGDIQIAGGKTPLYVSFQPSGAYGGIGSPSGRAMGSGGNSGFNGNGSAPSASSGYGGGGSGGCNLASQGTARSGGNGALGVVIVELYG